MKAVLLSTGADTRDFGVLRALYASLQRCLLLPSCEPAAHNFGYLPRYVFCLYIAQPRATGNPVEQLAKAYDMINSFF